MPAWLLLAPSRKVPQISASVEVAVGLALAGDGSKDGRSRGGAQLDRGGRRARQGDDRGTQCANQRRFDGAEDQGGAAANLGAALPLPRACARACAYFTLCLFAQAEIRRMDMRLQTLMQQLLLKTHSVT